MALYTFQSIGLIYSSFHTPEGMPIQSAAAGELSQGEIRIFPEFQEGLKDIEGFSHLILIYCLHQVKGSALTVTPFLDTKERGIFATRSPRRPNPIGMSVVRLLNSHQGILKVSHLDILNQTPLLDIKPYIPQMDIWQTTSIGWYESRIQKMESTRSDLRFSQRTPEKECEK